MSTVFPVEFELASENGLRSRVILLQGFTRDVGEGGMCIELKSFGRETERRLQVPDITLDLTINPSFSVSPIHARAKIIWLKKQENPLPVKYQLGVEYIRIDANSRKRLIDHARRMLWVPRIVFLFGLVLICLLGFFYIREQKLVQENSDLVQELKAVAGRKSEVAEDLVDLDVRKKVLEEDLDRTREELKRLEIENLSLSTQTTQMSEAFMKQREEFDLKVSAQKQKESDIYDELSKVREGQAQLTESYKSLERSGKASESVVFDQMTHWLLSHQNQRTGLVASFEGDMNLEDVAFLYDQSLAAQAFLLFGYQEKSRKILEFFSKRAKTESGAYYNAYDAMGGAPQENKVHTGPNVWLGIAALQYEHKVGGGEFLGLAERIGDVLLRLQDEEGGLRGGPEEAWYSTEHNLDAYAFFGMLSEATQNNKYKDAQSRVLFWIKKYAYSAKDNRMNRGKGDGTVATDTFGWAIAAIGPKALKAIEFDADGIMDFAEKNCVVMADFKQEGEEAIKVRGFDFAKAQHLGRGGVISCEWTAQMIVGFQVMARYYGLQKNIEKAAAYRQKANLYLSELQKMVITSPSRTGQGRGCLPYASTENVDTGHGWRTPRGASTGSVASTAYGLFAWKEYNPFELYGGDR